MTCSSGHILSSTEMVSHFMLGSLSSTTAHGELHLQIRCQSVRDEIALWKFREEAQTFWPRGIFDDFLFDLTRGGDYEARLIPCLETCFLHLDTGCARTCVRD